MKARKASEAEAGGSLTVAGPEGVWECEFVGECSLVCPKHVDPAAAIQRTKLSASMEWMRNLVMPWAAR